MPLPPNLRVGREQSNLNKYVQTQIFQQGDTEWEYDGDLEAWKLVGCIPVYRQPAGPWNAREGHSTQTIWFLPELFGDSETIPDSVVTSLWIYCAWDGQAGRWLVLPGSGGSSLTRFVLETALPVCGEATANIIDCECDATSSIMVVDSAGLATLEMDRDTGGEYAPAGSVGWAMRRSCNESSSESSSSESSYDIVSIGIGCCGSSGSSSSSECLQLPGIIMDDIPIVMPVAGQDYVLGYQDGCLVRFPIAACRQDSGSSV